MAKRKKYVTKQQVEEGLHRGCLSTLDSNTYWDDTAGTRGCNPVGYIKTLRAETGLSYAKIAHDLRMDSGVDVADSTVAFWGRK